MIFSFSCVIAQNNEDCNNCPAPSLQKNINIQEPHDITIYPNPVGNYFRLDNPIGLKEVKVFNMVGKEVASHHIRPDNKYNVESLRKGLYLIQLIGKNKDVVLTKRISKK